MASSATITHVSSRWKVVRWTVLCCVLVSLVLLHVCMYLTLRSQLHQLRVDVDQLKTEHSPLGTVARNELPHQQRSKRHNDNDDDGSFNQSASAVQQLSNHTSQHVDVADDQGSGEVTDNQQYRGIWMGTYSRVPMSAVREYCLAMSEHCPPATPGSPGERGSPGTKGERGLTGRKGDRGEKGDTGDTGLPGTDGIPGTDGVNGTDGEKGRRGKRGRHGELGEKGEKGDHGVKGPPGQLLPNDTVRLIRGQRGMPGPRGLPGPKGDQGQPGDSCGCITTESTTQLTTTVEPTVEPRLRDCHIRVIGKPLFHKSTATYWGMWLKDSRPHQLLGEKFYLTRHVTGKSLYYYNSLEHVKTDQPDGQYELTELFFGTGNVVYNGSYYYHRAGYNEIIKFDLVQNVSTAKVEIPLAAYQAREYLYSQEYNYFDLAVDDNGLWLIYAASEQHDSLLVSKLDADTLTIQKTWHIAVRHRDYGNGFVACGLLYLVRDVVSRSTTIDYAYDLYTKERRDVVGLRFNNPYQMNNMIAYNHAERQIYSWDRGHLLTYPLLLHN